MERRSQRYAAAVVVAVVVVMVGLLWLAGRVWWCACGEPAPFVGQVQSAHNSQHVFDWYSFSHLLHGVVFFLVLAWLPWTRGLSTAWKLAVALAVEAVWEVVENSPIVIERYRAATAAVGYEGDSIVNSVADLGFCALGFFVARAVGWRASVALFVVVEVGMLLAIRDNLTLNVVMLLLPLESVRAWQMGGG